jgi:hypothetical protein
MNSPIQKKFTDAALSCQKQRKKTSLSKFLKQQFTFESINNENNIEISHQNLDQFISAIMTQKY